MLVEMEIDREARALRQIEQSLESARRIGAGVEARADQVGAHFDGTPQARERTRIGERARPKRIYRVGAVGMGMQIDEAWKREPIRLRALLVRADGRNQSVAQYHAPCATAVRQRNGVQCELIGHCRTRVV